MKKWYVIAIVLLFIFLAQGLMAQVATTDKDAPGVGTSEWNRALENRYPENSNWINSSIFAVFGYINRFTQSILKWSTYISRIFFLLDLIVLGIYLAFNMVELKKEIVMRIIKVAVISSCIMWYPSVMNYIIATATQIATLPDQEIANKVSKVASERLGNYERELEQRLNNNENWLGVGLKQVFTPGLDSSQTLIGPLERKRLEKTIAYLKAFKDIEGRPKVYYHSAMLTTPLPPWMLKPLNTSSGAIYVDPEYIMMWGGLAFQPLKDDIDRIGPMEIGKAITLNLVLLLGNICLVICVIQYLMTILEFAMLTAVGSLCLPLGYFKLTQFAIEKLIGSIFAFAIKIIISTMVVQLIIYCYVDLTTVSNWASTNDQVLKFIFTSLFCIILSTTIPNVVSSFLSGTPNLGLSQVAQVGHAIVEGFQTAFMMRNVFTPHNVSNTNNSENRSENNANTNAQNNQSSSSNANASNNNSGETKSEEKGKSKTFSTTAPSTTNEGRVPSSELAGSLESKEATALKQYMNNVISGGSSPLNPARIEEKATGMKVEEKAQSRRKKTV